MFQQQCYPRISKDSLLPIAKGPFTADTKHLWYLPGHGDIYASLFRSGLLENLINQGKEYIFISNIDNLSATVDLKVLYHLMNEDTEFCMEIVPRRRRTLPGAPWWTTRVRPGCWRSVRYRSAIVRSSCPTRFSPVQHEQSLGPPASHSAALCLRIVEQ